MRSMSDDFQAEYQPATSVLDQQTFGQVSPRRNPRRGGTKRLRRFVPEIPPEHQDILLGPESEEESIDLEGTGTPAYSSIHLEMDYMELDTDGSLYETESDQTSYREGSVFSMRAAQPRPKVRGLHGKEPSRSIIFPSADFRSPVSVNQRPVFTIPSARNNDRDGQLSGALFPRIKIYDVNPNNRSTLALLPPIDLGTPSTSQIAKANLYTSALCFNPLIPALSPSPISPVQFRESSLRTTADGPDVAAMERPNSPMKEFLDSIEVSEILLSFSSAH